MGGPMGILTPKRLRCCRRPWVGTRAAARISSPLLILAFVLGAAACGGGAETVTGPSATPSTSDAPVSSTTAPVSATTLPAWADDGSKAAIWRLLMASDQIPRGSEVVGVKVSGDWAGAQVADGVLQVIPVLLQRSGSADAGAEEWTIVEVGKIRSKADLVKRGIPEEVAAFLAECST